MSDASPLVIREANLSRLWSRILVHAIDHAGDQIAPLVATLSDFDGNQPVAEIVAVRDALDTFLRSSGDFEVATVANTIFPQSVWRIAEGSRAVLYDEYVEALPRYAAMEPLNSHGTYFSRMIAFDVNPRTGERTPKLSGVPEGGNQLENVIRLLAEGKLRRQSALQVSIFDPTRDHSKAAQKGFPCMQHMTFIRTGSRGLALNAFYATQLIVRKAYGNLLGLCRLGSFVASQANLEFARLTVFVGSEKMGGEPKSSARLAPVVAAARRALAEARSGESPAPEDT